MISKTQSALFTAVLFFLCLAFPFLAGNGDVHYSEIPATSGVGQTLPTMETIFPPIASAIGSLTAGNEILLGLFAGLALFGLIFFSLKFVNTPLASPEGILLVVLLLFNPMLSTMAGATDLSSLINLTGTATALAILVLTIRDDNRPEQHKQVGIVLTGLLAGLAPFYLPLVILPALVTFGRSERRVRIVALFVAGVALWLIPTMIATGVQEWMHGLSSGIGNYFAEFNRVIQGFPDVESKRVGFLHTLVETGLGGYWASPGGIYAGGRVALSLLVSLGLLICFARGAWWMFHRETDGLVITVACISIFLVWAMFYQFDMNQIRYAVPLLPILLYPIWGGAVQLMYGGWRGRLTVIIFLSAYMASGMMMARGG